MTEPGEALPELVIPERYRDGMAKIIGLEDEAFQELLRVLKEEPPAIDYLQLSSRIAAKVSTDSSEDIEDIMQTLDSLYAARTSFALPVDDFAEALRRAVEESDGEGLGLTSENGGRLKERLIQLLDLDSLDATRKALDVLLEHEHTLHGARIMTDIRPIFGPSTDDPPTGAVIVHMLKIGYHDESEEVKEFYLALDAKDTDFLINLLRRADSKAESLKRVLEMARVPYIDAR